MATTTPRRKPASGRRQSGRSRRKARRRRRRSLLRNILNVGIALGLVLAGFLTVAFIDANWRFAHRQTPSPVRVYSAPLLLEEGTILAREDLQERLRRLGYRQVQGRPRIPGEYSLKSRTFEIHLNAFDYPLGRQESFPLRLRITFERVRRLENAATGENLETARIEPEVLGVLSGHIHEDRTPIPLDKIPQSLVDAVIAVEDRRFRRHLGIDPRGIARALLANIRSGEVVQGGSTITQQLAKNLYEGTGERTIIQKIWESLAALGLELFRSKDAILERYLNEIYLAQRGPFAVVGVGAASRHYFGKEARHLDLPESALLAGMLRSPGRYHPYRHPDVAEQRRNLVLKLMLDEGFIDGEAYGEALAAPLSVRAERPQQPRQAPYFLDYIAQELQLLVSRNPLHHQGMRVFTTLDPLLQARAESILDRKLASYERHYHQLREMEGGALQGAVIAMRPEDGSILAMVGGRDYQESQFNRVTQAHRQPGSLFKPFVYLAGFRKAQMARDSSFTAATLLDDSPLEMKVGGRPWAPRNYDGEYRGPVSSRQALALSLNVPTVRAAEMIGLSTIVKAAQRCGIDSRLEPVPSLALGTFEVTPLEIASAFTSFANLGFRAAPLAVSAIVDPDGVPIAIPGRRRSKATSPEAAYLTVDLLRDVLLYGTGRQVWSSGLQGDFAGKTGTTDEGRDAWFIGFTPDYLALTWVGFDHNRPLHLGGSTLAIPIWTALTGGARIDATRRWEPPKGLRVKRIDPETGQLAGWHCPASVRELFIDGTEPTEPCRHERRPHESWAKRLLRWFSSD